MENKKAELVAKLENKKAELQKGINQLKKKVHGLKLAKHLEAEGSGVSQGVGSSDIFDSVSSSAKDSVNNSSHALDQFVHATTKFFARARQELQGGTDETTILSMTEEKSLSTNEAQQEIDQADHVILEIAAEVARRGGGTL